MGTEPFPAFEALYGPHNPAEGTPRPPGRNYPASLSCI